MIHRRKTDLVAGNVQTLILDVGSHCFGIHDHRGNGLAEFVRGRLHLRPELGVLRVLHLPLGHQEDPVGAPGDARRPGNQHLRLVVAHGDLALLQVLLNGVLRGIQQGFGVNSLINQTWEEAK